MNTALPTSVDNTHSFFYVKFNLILQLIKGISNDLKKLLKYFNGTTTFTPLFVMLPSRTGSPNKLTLYLKELKLSAVKLATASSSGGSSRYIDKELLMNLDNYLNILLNYT